MNKVFVICMEGEFEVILPSLNDVLNYVSNHLSSKIDIQEEADSIVIIEFTDWEETNSITLSELLSLQETKPKETETTFSLTFTMGNDAFQYGRREAVSAILKSVSERVRNNETEGIVKDTNGNDIGSFKIVNDKERE